MAWLIVHVVTFAAVNAFVVFVWLVTGGDRDLLELARTQPVDAVRDGFWPGWVIASWAPLLVIHAGAWAADVLSGRRRRRRRRQRRLAGGHEPRTGVATAVRQAAATHMRQKDEWIRNMTKQWSQPRRAPWSIFGCDGDGDPDPLGASGAADQVTEVATGTVPAPPPARQSGRHWVAVMFTDICQSTELAEALGDDAWIEMLAGHRQLVRQCLGDNGGSEVGTQGDGFLVRFDAPKDAVACAVDIQRRVAARRAADALEGAEHGDSDGPAPPRTPEVRIGIHAGEAIAEEGDLVGRVINLAYRVAAVAEAGDVLVTEQVADHVAPSTVLVDRGLLPLKGIAQRRHLLAVEWQQPAPAPAPATEPASDAQLRI